MNRNLIYILIIVLLSFISYSNTLGNDFVWDDSKFVLDSPEVLSLERSVKSFTTDQFDLYRPIRSMFYFATFRMFSMNPALYHLFAILLHTIVSILVFYIIKNIFSRNIALFSASLFSTHPFHIGRVSNITASFDIIGIVFMLTSFLFYIYYRKNPSKKQLIFSIIFFILALFSSEESYTLPLLLLLYEFISKKKYKTTFVYSGILAIFLILRIFILKIGARVESFPGGSALVTFLTMPKVVFQYIFLSFIPINLSPFRKTEYISNFLDIWFLIPFFLILLLVYFVYKYKSSKELIFFSGWFIITLLPFLNITPLQTIMAERYFYLASISTVFLISFIILKLPKNYRLPLIGLLTIVFISLTIFNNTFWKDEYSLMQRGISLNPDSSQAHNNLGSYYFERDDLEKAFEHFQKAVESDPDNDKAWINLGVLYSKIGEYNLSIAALESALTINSLNYIAYEKLGITYMRLDDMEMAKESLFKSITLNPDYYRAHSKLGALYYNSGDVENSVLHLHIAMQINPFYAEPFFNMGLLLENSGKTEEAKTFYKRAASLEPNNQLYVSKLS